MPRETPVRPRVGVPYRTRNEEVGGKREKYSKYLRAIEEAGGEPVEISLGLLRIELSAQARSLDAVVLPGSPADVDPVRYRTPRHPQTADADPLREQTDIVLLDDAFGEGKPVLAICYGVQLLNVYLGGSLFQDIRSELSTTIQHPWKGREAGAPEPRHAISIESGSRLAQLAGAAEAVVNSSHHQSIREPGKGLRVVAHAPDGVIEAVEWTGDVASQRRGAIPWVTGVQWHPERMEGDAFSKALFLELLAAARGAPVRG